MNLRVIATAVGAIFVCGLAYGQVPDPRAGASTPVQVMNKASNPVPVTGTVTGTVNVSNTVNVSKTQTTALLEMVGLPMNFSTTTPLDTSQCSSLRVVLRAAGPSLLFTLTTPVGGGATGNTPYFGTLIQSNEFGSEVVEVPPPVTNVAMGISGDCPTCVLGIYCR